jgi:hypothetical protein
MSEVPTDHRCVKFTDCFGNIYNAKSRILTEFNFTSYYMAEN